ncbi:MAG: DUF3120 domain-containing protein [Acaryochloridaceae cyanobacterium RU_4_10]|nr:DUF3120 domain-containing protein [Acaryochloridaceae cyanobacterium RU_4_10]
MSAFTSTSASSTSTLQRSAFSRLTLGSKLSWGLFGVAAFLVSIPVFVQAPLVRQWPWTSLFLTLGWVALGYALRRKATTALYGDLILGFSLSWLAGSIYWGWFRWEPLVHLPIEAIAVPVAIWAIVRQRYWVGALFYLGSLWGTAVTDLYFYVVHLIPYWRQVMQIEPEGAFPILREALQHMQTPWGILWVGLLVSVLCVSGLLPFTQLNVFKGDRTGLHWWVFSGAVMSTLLVDGLFWLAARLA